MSERTVWTVVNAAVAAGFSAALIAFGEPTDVTSSVAAPLLALGASWTLWTAIHERDDAAVRLGGPFRYCRNPAYLGGLLLSIGLTVMASSDGSTARWLPRTVAPLGLLYLFAAALPAADARVREAVRAGGGAAAGFYLQCVPALIPRMGVPKSIDSNAASAAPRTWRAAAVLVFALADFAFLIWKRGA